LICQEIYQPMHPLLLINELVYLLWPCLADDDWPRLGWLRFAGKSEPSS